MMKKEPISIMNGIKNNMKQYIIIRKDLPMSAGKLAAQACHASMSFLTHILANHIENVNGSYEIKNMLIDKELWEEWLNPSSSFAKVILSVKNENQLNKIITKAKEYGLIENKDFYCIKDEARTELSEYTDDDGKVLTCIGFKPCKEEDLKPIVGKLQLYKK